MVKPSVKQPIAIQKPLVFDLKSRAIGYYLHYQIKPLTPQPQDAQSISENLLDAVSILTIAPYAETLDLAIAPLALAVFARTHQHQPAAVAAATTYLKLLQNTQRAVASLTETDIEICLVSIIFMGRYEDAIYDPSGLSAISFGESVLSRLHHNGALAILKVWKERFGTYKPATNIMKHSRRALVWAAVLQGTPLPAWLQEGSHFGYWGLDLEHDRILSQVVQIRHKFTLLSDNIALKGRSLQLAQEAEALYHETKAMDNVLQEHMYRYPEHWRYWSSEIVEKQSYPTRYFFCPRVHVYGSCNYALFWIKYFSLRILVNGTRFKIARLCSTATDLCTADRQFECLSSIQDIADDLTCSIPYCLGQIRVISNPSSKSREGSVVLNKENNIHPYLASTVAWPLSIASSISGIDFKQKHWFKRIVADVGRVTGIAFFQYAENEQWLHL